MRLNKIISLCALLIIPILGIGNAAQPGLWQAGGTGTFSLLFPDDSASYKKIQMVKERVFAQLYDGYAVVMGKYWMYNDTEDTVKIRTGYPINSLIDKDYGRFNADLSFDELYKLKVLSNGEEQKILENPIVNPYATWSEENWYVWWNDFPPKDTTELTVYFIVNTSEAKLNRGYAKDHVNGFVYLLESGSTWKQPIKSGEIILQIMPEVSMKSIRGIYPDSIFLFDSAEQMFWMSFEDLSPGPDDNIILTYEKEKDSFNFASAVAKADELFAKVGILEFMWLNTRQLSIEKFGDPFEVRSVDGFSRALQIAFFAVIAVPTLLLAWLIYVVYRRIKRKRA